MIVLKNASNKRRLKNSQDDKSKDDVMKVGDLFQFIDDQNLRGYF
tara:strand:+ start:321 stop:455 length:135 start_codon:yes stop_codon:yes gene_type:complete